MTAYLGACLSRHASGSITPSTALEQRRQAVRMGKKGSPPPHPLGAASQQAKLRVEIMESTLTKGNCPVSSDWTGDPDPIAQGHATPLTNK